MARIHAGLRDRLKKKLGVTERHVNRLIAEEVNRLSASPNIAALSLARREGIPIARFASPEEMTELRSLASPGPVQVAATLAPAAIPASKRTRGVKTPQKRKPSNLVWVVHGRDIKARDGLYGFLLAIGLTPLEWNQALANTKKGAPYVGEVLDSAFDRVGAVVVLLTPDDEARLRTHLRGKKEPSYERELTPQARPNALFEAGMAFGRHPDRTVIVQLGTLRPFSNIGGRHLVNMNNSTEKRQELGQRLEAAGADVNLSGTHWHQAGNFEFDWIE